MNHILLFALGTVAAGCTTFSFLPQLIKAWRTKSTGDISLPMFVVLATGIALWIVYAAIQADIPLAVGNVISLTFVVSILLCKLRYG